MQNSQTPLEDLKKEALKHYGLVSGYATESHSDIPKAIEFYYDHQIREQEKEDNFYKWAWFMLKAYLFICALTVLAGIVYNLSTTK